MCGGTLPGDGTTKWNWVLYAIPAEFEAHGGRAHDLVVTPSGVTTGSFGRFLPGVRRKPANNVRLERLEVWTLARDALGVFPLTRQVAQVECRSDPDEDRDLVRLSGHDHGLAARVLARAPGVAPSRFCRQVDLL